LFFGASVNFESHVWLPAAVVTARASPHVDS
jgi:hypothetical protein